MKYFRVELDRAGMLLKCDEVSRAHFEAPEKNIFFVPAETASEAVGAAYRQYKERLQANNVRRNEAVAAGKCRDCSDPAVPGQTRCAFCQSRNSGNRKRARALKRGVPVKDLPERIRSRERRRILARLGVLQEVLHQFRKLFTADFEQWLVDEVNEAREATMTPLERHRRECRD
jgi:hypothetical protein